MPNWQRQLSYPSFYICLGSGFAYLIFQVWTNELTFLINRWVLIVHGVSAMVIAIILVLHYQFIYALVYI